MADFAGYKRIMIPLFQEADIPTLTDMARALAAEHCVVYMLVLVTGQDLDRETKLQLEVAQHIENTAVSGVRLQLVSVPTSWAVRGVLDAAREWRVDLLLLTPTVPTPRRHSSQDRVIGNLLTAVSCPVIIYHPQALLTQIATAGQNAEPNLPAAAIASHLQNSLNLSPRPHYQLPPNFENNGHLLPHDQTLYVIYLNEDAEQNLWVSRDLTTQNANTLFITSPTKLPSHSLHTKSLPNRIQQWLTPRLTLFEKDEMVLNAELSASATLDYTVLILISALLAGLGLLLNSNAVIIGAMLVAPLMSPLISFATGMAIGRVSLVRRATISLFEGIAAALLISLALGFFSTTELITAEMAARGNPTTLDMAVAVVSGIMGGYAAARRDISSALAGVAIAAALMPPLVTVGLALSFADFALAFGAALLFATNIVSIILGAWGTLFLLGIRPIHGEQHRTRQRTSALMVTLFFVLLGVLVYQNFSVVFAGQIEGILRNSFYQSELIRYEIRRDDPLYIRAFIYTDGVNNSSDAEIVLAERNLENTLGTDVILDVVAQPIIRADVVSTNAEAEATITLALQANLTNSRLLRMRFQLGNPTLVVALVEPLPESTEEDLAADRVAAERAIQSALGFPVNLFLVPIATDGEMEEIEEVNEDMEAVIEEILTMAMPSMTLLNYSFVLGNPTTVVAYVSTSLDSQSEQFAIEVFSAELLLSQAIGLPVQLTVIPLSPTATPTLTIEPEIGTTPALNFQIETTIRETLQNSTLVTFSYQDQGNRFDIEVFLRTAVALDSPELQADVVAMQAALETFLGKPVRLELIVQQEDGTIIEVVPEDLPTPESTPEPEPEPEGTNEAAATPTVETTGTPEATPTIEITTTVELTATTEITPTIEATITVEATPTIEVTPTEEVTNTPEP
jgi:uncharacterized hydrophobic protein (TIGR00271 family)